LELVTTMHQKTMNSHVPVKPIYQEVPVCVYRGSHRPGAIAVRDAVINGLFAQRRLASIACVRCCIHHTEVGSVISWEVFGDLANYISLESLSNK